MQSAMQSKSSLVCCGAGDWEISPEDIEICRHPDGSEWLLGQGRFGQVCKALKGGVQVIRCAALVCA